MKRLLCTLTAVLFLCGVSAIGQDQTWRGTLAARGQQVSFEVVITHEEGARTGTLSILGQGMVPLTSVDMNAEELRFSHTGAKLRFEGTLSETGTVASGTFFEGSQGMPLTLYRFEPARGEPVETWFGTLKIEEMELPMRVRLFEQAGQRTAIFDSLAENKSYRATWSVTEERVELKVPFIQLVFEGNLDASRVTAAGRWRQADRDLPFELEKRAATELEEPALARQRPKGKSSQGRVVRDAPIPAEAYERLAARVQAMVDDEEIVGGELLVIKNRDIRFRRAFGWKDREAEQPMTTGAVYCVRSMTKPLVGMAIQILIDEGKLELGTPVYQILPAFEGGWTEKITVAHLLTHTAGFPFTTISKPLGEYADLTAVAAEAAAREPRYEPGSRFSYSDASSDTLGAIVSALTGAPAERFIQERILDPLGMKDSFTLLADNETRIPSAYSGGTSAWARHWKPSDPPIFPIFLTSQSLYATTTDYARFLALWMDGGRIGDRRLLSEQAVERALAPSQAMGAYPADFGGLEVSYGHQWIVHHAPGPQKGKQPIVFGHDGSDGTHAWAWPDLDMMVLFFTQSRGTLAGVSLAATVQTLLVEQDLDEPLPSRTPAGVSDEVAGLYWDETAVNAYYVVTPMGDRLSLERPGKMFAILEAGERPGHFVHESRADRWIEFIRAEDGRVTGMRTFFGGAVELDPRHVVQTDLPSVEEVTAMVKRGHRIDRLAHSGVVRLSGRFELESRGMAGTVSTLLEGRRERQEVHMGTVSESVLVHDQRVWSETTHTGTEELSGQRKVQHLVGRLCVLYGDWSREYEHVEVLKRLRVRDRSLLLIRVVPHEGFGATMFVDEASGLVVRTESLVQIPGMGIVGVATSFDDYREVGGMVLPFRIVAEFASKLLGRAVTTFEQAETGVEVARDTFEGFGGPAGSDR